MRLFIEERGEFQMFSPAKHADGKFNAVQPPNEFPDQRSAMIEAVKVLMSLARDGQIAGDVLCTPVNEDGRRLAILDVEHKECGRILAFLPYKNDLSAAGRSARSCTSLTPQSCLLRESVAGQKRAFPSELLCRKMRGVWLEYE